MYERRLNNLQVFPTLKYLQIYYRVLHTSLNKRHLLDLRAHSLACYIMIMDVSFDRIRFKNASFPWFNLLLASCLFLSIRITLRYVDRSRMFFQFSFFFTITYMFKIGVQKKENKFRKDAHIHIYNKMIRCGEKNDGENVRLQLLLTTLFFFLYECK